MKTIIRFSLLLAAVFAQCDSGSLATPPDKDGGGGDRVSYEIVTLIPPGPPVWESRVGDMNEVNDVVGFYQELDGTNRPFYYDFLSDEFITLSGTGGAFGVNNHGEAVGGDDFGGLYWASSQGAPVALPSPNTGDWTQGNDINDAGIITGVSGGSAVVWSITNEAGGVAVSQPIALSPLLGDDSAAAYRLSEPVSGGSVLVVGKSTRLEQIGPDAFVEWDLAVVWEVTRDGNGTLIVTAGPLSLGTLNGGLSVAHAVNFPGDVCGESDSWPFLNPAGGAMLPLPGLRNAASGSASDVNNNGAAVGFLRFQDRWGGISDVRAVLWHEGDVVDLSKAAGRGSGWEKLERAFEINSGGSIAGTGVHESVVGGTAGYLLISK